MIKYAKLPFNEGIMNDDSVLFSEINVWSYFRRWEGVEKGKSGVYRKLPPGEKGDTNAFIIKNGELFFVFVPDDEPVFFY